jgi:hypothetical protein
VLLYLFRNMLTLLRLWQWNSQKGVQGRKICRSYVQDMFDEEECDGDVIEGMNEYFRGVENKKAEKEKLLSMTVVRL